MKRKNLIVIKKVNNKELSIKNFKIKKTYAKFKTVISKEVNKKSFALAVSGGPDSLSLAYFGKMYVHEFKNKMHVLIVDHKLRKESRREATKVKEILKKKV